MSVKYGPMDPRGQMLLRTSFPKRDRILHVLYPRVKVLEVHDDGDLTAKIGRETYVITTEGQIFKRISVKSLLPLE